MIRSSFLFLLTIASFNCFSQESSSCKALHDGTYYFYSPISNGHGIYIREGGWQKEINREKGDTVLWKVKWKDDCHYLLTYQSGNPLFDALNKDAKQRLATLVAITAVTDEYYLFQSFSPNEPGKMVGSDTLWRMDVPAKLVKKDMEEASFPGGIEAWKKYLTKIFEKHAVALAGLKKGGVCYVRFVVDKDGTVTDVRAMTMEGTLVSQIAVDVIESGPRWIPGKVNGKPAKMAKIQPITFETN